MVVLDVDLGSPRSVLYIASATFVLALTTLVWRHVRRKTPEQLERLRRLRINHVGRFVTGEIVEVLEGPHDSSHRVVVYHYQVGGVAYEASQDITTIRDRIEAAACIPGLPANVKYDPGNPGNSIVACEKWSGIVGKSASTPA
jgi:hypothetical protein